MPLPVAIASAYLAINIAVTVWLVRAETRGQRLPTAVTTLAMTMRYGPPFVGLLYLITLAADWPFFLFVAIFFATAFWLLGGLLNYPSRPPEDR